MKNILKVEDLRVTRSKKFTVHIDKLRINSGTILCIAGPNGSGKTTFIECLVGLLKPTSGRVSVNVQKIDQHLYLTRALLGYIPDNEDWFVKELCAKEYFALLSSVYAKAGAQPERMKLRIEGFADILGFTAFEHPLEKLSHGNKKKVQIIAGLMHEPKAIIVDEIRNGLDPLGIIAAEVILRREAKRGACIIAATHDLWWAQRIADETMLLVNGKVAIHQRTKTLLERYTSLEKLFIAVAENKELSDAAL